MSGTDDGMDAEDFLFSAAPDANQGQRLEQSDNDDDWAPPSEVTGELPGLMDNAGDGFADQSPVHRNPLPTDEDDQRAASIEGFALDEAVDPVMQHAPEPQPMKLPDLTMPEPIVNPVAAPAMIPAKKLVKQQLPKASSRALAGRPPERPSTRPAGFILPPAVLFAGAGIGGYLSLGSGFHLLGALAMALGVVGALLVWVMVRE